MNVKQTLTVHCDGIEMHALSRLLKEASGDANDPLRAKQQALDEVTQAMFKCHLQAQCLERLLKDGRAQNPVNVIKMQAITARLTELKKQLTALVPHAAKLRDEGKGLLQMRLEERMRVAEDQWQRVLHLGSHLTMSDKDIDKIRDIMQNGMKGFKTVAIIGQDGMGKSSLVHALLMHIGKPGKGSWDSIDSGHHLHR